MLSRSAVRLSPFRLAAASRPFSSSARAQLAKLTVVGRLGADPELMTLSSGVELVKYVVGTSHGPANARQTSWWRVVKYVEEGKGREKMMSLTKGSLVYVEAEATMRKFEKDGKLESSMNLVQHRVEVLKRAEPSTENAEESAE